MALMEMIMLNVMVMVLAVVAKGDRIVRVVVAIAMTMMKPPVAMQVSSHTLVPCGHS